MPKFPKNTGFKLPGLSSRELNTPGGFRKDQGVEDVGYCDNTEFSMLPQGSSPLLLVKPEYYKTTYTKTNWPKGKGMPEIQLNNKEEEVEETPPADKKIPKKQITSTHTDRQIKADVNQEEGTTHRGATQFKKGTNVDEAKTWIKGEKDKIRKNNPGLSKDEITQLYREKFNIGKVTHTPGKTTITQTYWVNGEQVSKAKYDAAGPNKKKEIKKTKGNSA